IGGVVERRALKLGLVAALVLALFGAVLASRAAIARARAHADRAPAPDVTAPEGTRIRVQVLNATAVRGLARRATMLLRDRGFDVVEIGTWTQQLDSTLV